MFRVSRLLIILLALVLFPSLSNLTGNAQNTPSEFFIYLPLIIFTNNHANNMVTIPAGTFQMGCDPAHTYCGPWEKRELPLHTVYLDSYRIDKNLVTNGQYSLCETAGSCTPPHDDSSSTRPFYFRNPIYSNYPIIKITWNDAQNYCTWVGNRLPSEAEWEKAARGSIDTRNYPWGDQTPNCTLANSWINSTSTCVGDTNEVGTYSTGASPYGVADLAGNVMEWVKDWYSDTYYSISPSINPPGPEKGTWKVLRGGSWKIGYTWLRVFERGIYYSPGSYDNDIGFRCAANP